MTSLLLNGLPAHRKYGKRRAFTLIELLVVVAVVLVLMALLLPALESAQRAARSANCLSNLKQILLGGGLYANDFDGSVAQNYVNSEGTSNPWADIYGTTPRRGAGVATNDQKEKGFEEFTGLGYLQIQSYNTEYIHPKPDRIGVGACPAAPRPTTTIASDYWWTTTGFYGAPATNNDDDMATAFQALNSGRRITGKTSADAGFGILTAVQSRLHSGSLLFADSQWANNSSWVGDATGSTYFSASGARSAKFGGGDDKCHISIAWHVNQCNAGYGDGHAAGNTLSDLADIFNRIRGVGGFGQRMYAVTGIGNPRINVLQ